MRSQLGHRWMDVDSLQWALSAEIPRAPLRSRRKRWGWPDDRSWLMRRVCRVFTREWCAQLLSSCSAPAPTNNSSYIGRVISFYFVFVFVVPHKEPLRDASYMEALYKSSAFTFTFLQREQLPVYDAMWTSCHGALHVSVLNNNIRKQSNSLNRMYADCPLSMHRCVECGGKRSNLSVLTSG